MPTLRANPHTFMFAIPGGQTFYSVLIAASKDNLDLALATCSGSMQYTVVAERLL